MEDPLRFSVHYLITARSDEEAAERAEKLCIEQTAEMPADTIPKKIRDSLTGQVVIQKKVGREQYETVISYPVSAAGGEITQCLNLLFGNISLKPGINLSAISWYPLTGIFPGPGLGISGIRERLNIHNRPISCSALKPMGLKSEELAERCYQMARGGLDIIKDDHGLANQDMAPFTDRITKCLEAIDRAADETGKRSAYFPNITGDCFETWRRYEIAQELGAGGVLIIPQLTGLSAIKSLAGSENHLPVMAHPAFSGSFVLPDGHGFTPGLYYGSLWRALGADIVIYPNAGGRFSFSQEQCNSINTALRTDESPFLPAFPSPGGGIQRKNINKWMKKYGANTIFLIGGSLYQHPGGIETGSKEFQDNIEAYE